MSTHIQCPPPFQPLFEQAEAILTPMFEDIRRNLDQGSLLVGGERYVLNRAQSLALKLREELERVAGPAADSVIYRLGKAIGASDATHFMKKFPDQEMAFHLAMGPVAFLLMGYAGVTIFPQSNPVPSEDFLLLVEHPDSFEAMAYLEAGHACEKPVCYQNSGFAAGWCGQVFGLTLEAKEITCKAKGDAACRFITAPPSRLRERIAEFGDMMRQIEVPTT